MEWSLQGDGGRLVCWNHLQVGCPKPLRVCRGEQDLVDKKVDMMTLKVFSIFSVYGFVIIRFSLKCSKYSYSLGPETHKIIVRKMYSGEMFSRNHPFLAILLLAKLTGEKGIV